MTGLLCWVLSPTGEFLPATLLEETDEGATIEVTLDGQPRVLTGVQNGCTPGCWSWPGQSEYEEDMAVQTALRDLHEAVKACRQRLTEAGES